VPDARFEQAIAAIDAANADDPNRLRVQGIERPKELAHAEMASAWVRRLNADAGEALLLAARAHHIRRWTIPRDSYPAGRQGYLAWRRALQEFHAAQLSHILRDAGYGAETIARAESIVRKRNPWTDPDVQTLEDALCLVFLETQFEELAGRLDAGKMLDVLRKTLRKMSEPAKLAALSLPLAEREAALLKRAAGDH
jgi:hypothetical protein